jgi:hypothetical protein
MIGQKDEMCEQEVFDNLEHDDEFYREMNERGTEYDKMFNPFEVVNDV